MKKPFRPISMSTVFFLLLLVYGSSCHVDSDSPNKEIDAIFEKYNSKTDPGCAVAVIHNGEILYKKGYGLANLEYDICITPSTVFDIASVSKQFAGLAVSTS